MVKKFQTVFKQILHNYILKYKKEKKFKNIFIQYLKKNTLDLY